MWMCCSARLTLLAVLATGLVAAGCASPPDAEKKAADTAVAAAQAVGAEKYAAQQFAALQVAVKTAEAQMTAKSYKEAKESYETAKRLADEALQAAAASKAAMKTQVETQVAALEKTWQELEQKAQAAAKKLKPDQKQAWDVATTTVKDALQAA